jgi:hypothetical protein
VVESLRSHIVCSDPPLSFQKVLTQIIGNHQGESSSDQGSEDEAEKSEVPDECPSVMNFGGEKGTHVRLLITDLAKCVNFVAVNGKIDGADATSAKIACDDLFIGIAKDP